MIYETIADLNISFSSDPESIRKLVGQEIFERLELQSPLITVLKRKSLVFAVLMNVRNAIMMYWMPFTDKPEKYSELGISIEVHQEIDLKKRIMQEGLKWHLRSKHPNWPDQLDTITWQFWDFQMKLRP